MDMLNLEKLLEQAQIAERIADGVVDDQAYNVITKAINESVLMEAQEEVEGILRRGKEIKGVVDLSQLEAQVNGAFGLTESAKTSQTTKGNNMKTQSLSEASFVAKPASVKTAKEFQNAISTNKSQTLNSNTEHEVDTPATFTGVESKGKSAQSAMQAGAKKNVGKFEDNAKKQDVPNELVKKPVTEGAVKFISFVESLKTQDNAPLIEAIIKGFKVVQHTLNESNTPGAVPKGSVKKESTTHDSNVAPKKAAEAAAKKFEK
jgi:hypothetical protein